MNPYLLISIVSAVAANQLFAQTELASPATSGPASTIPAKDNVDAGTTDLMLQDQFQSASKRAEQMQSVLDDVREAADRISKAKESLDQRVPPDDLKQSIERLQAAVNSLRDLPPSTALTKSEARDNPVGNFVKAYTDVKLAAQRPFQDIIATVSPFDLLYNERAQSPTERLIRNILKAGSFSFGWIRSSLPATDDVSQRFQRLPPATVTGAPNITKQSFDAQINAAQVELSAAVNETQNKLLATLRETLRGETSKIQAAFDAEIKKEQAAIDAVKRERQTVANQIQARTEKRESQKDTVNRTMIWAVIMMIVAIVLSFAALALYKAPLSLAVVEERTFVDLLSMGFLLVTVIVLGTGQFLDKQAIGTLLGTIAGYIFTRRLGTSEKQPARAESVAISDPPTGVSYDPAKHRVSAKRPAEAQGLIVYAKSSTKSPLVVGSSTTDSVLVDLSLLSSGTYDAWVVGTNAKGEGPPSDHFSITAP